jgi:hypothetical protein
MSEGAVCTSSRKIDVYNRTLLKRLSLIKASGGIGFRSSGHVRLTAAHCVVLDAREDQQKKERERETTGA